MATGTILMIPMIAGCITAGVVCLLAAGGNLFSKPRYVRAGCVWLFFALVCLGASFGALVDLQKYLAAGGA